MIVIENIFLVSFKNLLATELNFFWGVGGEGELFLQLLFMAKVENINIFDTNKGHIS